MATSNVVVVEIATMGPAGAGITPAEKAGLMPKAGGVFTGEAKTTPSSDTALTLYEKADGTDLVVLDTANDILKFLNGLDVEIYSDNGSTLVATIDAATGAAQFDSTVTTTRIVGDTSVWSVIIDGGGSPITTGVKFDLVVPYNALITAWDIFGDQTGSAVVDIWQQTYASWPPTNTQSITTSEEPTLSSAAKNQDTSLNSGNGWSVTQGHVLRFNVDSASTVQRLTIALHVTRV